LIRSEGGVFYALKNAPKKANNKIDLIVARVNRAGEICNARPCYNCLNMMKAVGIHKVYYSISVDKLVCENVKDMISIHVSSPICDIERNIKPSNEPMNKKMYYEHLLKKYFPTIIRKHNLDSFLRHNLSNVLPTFIIKITMTKSCQYVCIKNEFNHSIMKAQVIP
jgi:hypothetical protein